MVYHINGEHLDEADIQNSNLPPDSSYFCIFSDGELDSFGGRLGIPERFVKEYRQNNVPKYESHDGFDYLSINIPDTADQKKPPQRICVYLTARLLVFVCDNIRFIQDMIEEIKAEGVKNLSLGRILHMLLDRLTIDDVLDLESIEQEIAELEESLMISKKSEITNEIIALRRTLLTLKRYYEQLLEISEAIEQNENGFLDKKILRYFHMITDRIDRLYHDVLNLRDYVTQVREAYQAQIDINLNSIMKLFTVITSIFLPLTLIVGWYGMNVQMPEYGWKYGYLYVIGISVLSATIAIAYFKKNKWF